MSRLALDNLFATTRAEGRTAFLPFMTAGLPTPEETVDVFVAMAESGADAFEVGIPYSDPLMDGPTIQAGSLQALEHGMTLREAFEVVRRVVDATGKPSLMMSYANPIFRIGPDEFARRAADVGASGLIIADLPLEESAPVAEAAAAHGIGLVMFAAPTTPDERLAAIVATDPLFIYGIAEMGVTGERQRRLISSSRAVAAHSCRLRCPVGPRCRDRHSRSSSDHGAPWRWDHCRVGARAPGARSEGRRLRGSPSGSGHQRRASMTPAIPATWRS